MAEVLPDDVTAVAEGDPAAVVGIITSMAKAYTRGQGFDDNGEPNAEIAAAIVTASARLAANGHQLPTDLTAGAFAQSIRGGFTGWSLAERMVLDRYRVKAL